MNQYYVILYLPEHIEDLAARTQIVPVTAVNLESAIEAALTMVTDYYPLRRDECTVTAVFPCAPIWPQVEAE